MQYVECIVRYTNLPNQEPPLKQYNTICLIVKPLEITKQHMYFCTKWV